MGQNKKASNDYNDLSEIFSRYIAYWKWFAVSIILCTGLAFVLYKVQSPVFKTNANILVKPDDSKNTMGAMALQSLGVGGLAGSEKAEDEVYVISSYSSIRKMIVELGIYKTYTEVKFPLNKTYYKNSPITVDIPLKTIDTLSQSFKLDIKIKNNKAEVEMVYGSDKLEQNFTIDKFPETVKTIAGDLTFKTNGALKADKSYRFKVGFSSLNGLAESYKKIIKIAPPTRRSNIINMSILDKSPQKGRDILNTLVRLYNDDALEDKNQAARFSIQFIQERIDTISAVLKDIEYDIEDYKTQNNVYDLRTEAEYFLKNVGESQGKALEYRIQLSLAEMIEDYLKDSKNKYSLIPMSGVMSESLALSVKEYNNTMMERTRMLQSSSENNPIILSMNEHIDILRAAVVTSISNVKKELAVSLKDWDSQEQELRNRINRMPKQEREYIERRRQQELQSALYMLLLQKLQEAELTLASATSKAKIVDAAYTQALPVSPKKMQLLGLGFVLGFLIPFCIVYYKTSLRPKLSDVRSLKRVTDIPVLGEICEEKSAESIVVSATTTTAISELFRLLRTNIQFLLPKKEEKVILVTSSVSGEGKSFFVINFALSLSLIKDKKVVIVGLDIRNPKLAEYLSLKSQSGITTYLSSEEYKPEDVIVSLSHMHPNLAIVPAGPVPPNPSELLLSERLDLFFDYLRANYDYVVVDTAPVGMVSDTFSLARVSDATLYLFRADYTNKSYLKLAESIVEEDKLKKLYLVMNGTRTKTGYGYGYGEKK